MKNDFDMNIDDSIRTQVSRRTFLGRTAAGMGTVALASLLDRNLLAAEQPGILKSIHHRPRAKRVIFMVMAGGASHLETFDFKPKLAELNGQPMPESVTRGQPIAQLQGQKLKCFAPQHPFRRWGKSGQLISEAFPHIGSIADDICIVRSLKTEQINHDPAHTFMNTGTSISGRPSMGSWLWYGLGNDCDNLPGFVVMVSVGGAQDQPIASRQWHAGFLPSRYQGVQFQSKGMSMETVSKVKVDSPVMVMLASTACEGFTASGEMVAVPLPSPGFWPGRMISF